MCHCPKVAAPPMVLCFVSSRREKQQRRVSSPSGNWNWSTMLRCSIIWWHIDLSVACVAMMIVSYHLYPSLVVLVLLNCILLLHTGHRFFLATSLSFWSHLINRLPPCPVLCSNSLVNVILLKNTHNLKCNRCNIRCSCSTGRCSPEVGALRGHSFQTFC